MAALPGADTVVSVAAFLDIHVRPGARRTAIDGWHDGVVAVRVSAPPADGRANETVRRLLSDTLGVRLSSVTIVRGHTSRRKRLAFDTLTQEDLDAAVRTWGADLA